LKEELKAEIQDNLGRQVPAFGFKKSMGLIENIEGFYHTIDTIIDEGAGLTLDAEGKRSHFVSFI